MCAFSFGKQTFRTVGELSVGSLNVPLPYFLDTVNPPRGKGADKGARGRKLSELINAQGLDVTAFSEIKGRGVDWSKVAGRDNLKGLEHEAVPGYCTYTSKGTAGKEGVAIAIKKDIAHKLAYVDLPDLVLPEDLKGRLIIVELKSPCNIVFVAVYGPTSSRGPELKEAFWGHVSEILLRLKSNGKLPVLLGDLNLKPTDLAAHLPSWNFKSALGDAKDVRSTYFSNYKSETTHEEKDSFPQPNSVNKLNHVNLAKYNIETCTEPIRVICVDHILIDEALDFNYNGPEKMCGCNDSCLVPCSDSSHADVAKLFLLNLRDQAARARIDFLRGRDAHDPSDYVFLQTEYPTAAADDPCFHYQHSYPRDFPRELIFPFPQDFALLRYLPPWVTDHMLLTARIAVSPAAVEAVADPHEPSKGGGKRKDAPAAAEEGRAGKK